MRPWREALAEASDRDYGIIGDPVEHSLSPAMQEAAFAERGKREGRGGASPRYHRFHVPPVELQAAVRAFREKRLSGFNVTVPHKETVLPLLQAVDAGATAVGAVNTVSFNSGKLAGFNTDAEGFGQTLERLKAAPKTALVLGAGGTALVVINELLRRRAAVHMWNRGAERAKALTERIAALKRLHAEDVARLSPTFDLVVNATSVGLRESDGLAHPDLKFRQGQIVVDVIYHRETQFMKAAKAAGATVCGGLPMLLFQGAASFRIWTGAEPDIASMKRALDDALTKKGTTPIWPSDI